MARVDLTINAADQKRIRVFLRALEPRERESVGRFAMEAAMRETENDARENRIVRGRGKAPPLPDKLSDRTQTLIGSIGTDNKNAPRFWVVGSTAEYSSVHERGLRVGKRRYPKRPFLKPAADFVIRTKMRDFFVAGLKRARAQATVR